MRVVFKLMEPFLINKQVCATTAVNSRGNDDNNPFRETRDILTRIIAVDIILFSHSFPLKLSKLIGFIFYSERF